MIVGLDLIKKERNILAEMFFNREKAVAFLFEEMSMVNPDIMLP